MSLFIISLVGITAILYIIKIKAFIETDVNHLLEINVNSCVNYDARTFDVFTAVNSLYFFKFNLSEISLNTAILISINFKSANFSGVNLNIADINFVKDYFTGANLSESDTTNIKLRGGGAGKVNFRGPTSTQQQLNNLNIIFLKLISKAFNCIESY